MNAGQEQGEMDARPSTFEPANPRHTPIHKLNLEIAGTALEPVIAEFEREVRALGIRIEPHCYLSTEWGVPFPSVSIGIPFYLANDELTAYHGEQVGHFEGVGRWELLRYLRHEMGHVVNYAYQLYDNEEWVKIFGSMTQPYVEDYRPRPFSRDFVIHLPGWYAQKHPDEDWAETFAVWMTPGEQWREQYRDWPALRKLEFCDELMAQLAKIEPAITAIDADEAVASLAVTPEEYYGASEMIDEEYPQGLDGALRAIFDDFSLNREMDTGEETWVDATDLIGRIRVQLAADVFRWTGHFPERTHALLRHLSHRCDVLKQGYPQLREQAVTIAFTTLVTALAMNHVEHGNYLP